MRKNARGTRKVPLERLLDEIEHKRRASNHSSWKSRLSYLLTLLKEKKYLALERAIENLLEMREVSGIAREKEEKRQESEE